jgi:hypothetical protein
MIESYIYDIPETTNKMLLILFSLSLFITSANSQWTKLNTIQETEGNNEFGARAIIHENKLVICDPRSNTHATDGGKALMYTKDGSTWGSVSDISPTGLSDSDYFCDAIDVDDNTGDMVIGAWGGDAIYYYKWNGNGWDTPIKRIGPSGDQYGSSVAIDGTLIAVTSPLATTDQTYKGRIDIVEISAGPTLSDLDVIKSDMFTIIDDNFWVFAGTANPMKFKDGRLYFVLSESNAPDLISHLYVLHKPASSWVILTGPLAQTDRAAQGIDVNDGWLVFNDPTYNSDQGSVEVYSWGGSNWAFSQRITSNVPETNGGFGADIAVSATEMFVGVTGMDNTADGDGNDSDNDGGVEVFELSGGTWTYRETLRQVSEFSSRHSGGVVTRYNDELAIGGDDNLVGAYGQITMYHIPPTASPTNSPITSSPTDAPSSSPTVSPTTSIPSSSPTNQPTGEPTTPYPTDAPSNSPTSSPTTPHPTDAPSDSPTNSPTLRPTTKPATSDNTILIAGIAGGSGALVLGVGLYYYFAYNRPTTITGGRVHMKVPVVENLY